MTQLLFEFLNNFYFNFQSKLVFMKYFLTLTIIFSVFYLAAQNGTTLDEYRYLSKGYAYQIEMGLDPTKNGYEIRKNYTAKNGTTIIGLYQTNGKIPQGLLLVTTDANGKSYYRALPNPASADNVLALNRQDQTQHLPIAVRDKMAEAKDHYLFAIPGQNESSDLVQVKNPSVPAEVTPPVTSKPTRPVSYEAPNDQLTAKGGGPIIQAEKLPSPTPTNRSVSTTQSNEGGTIITGQLNAELNSRTILVQPAAQKTTKAKGRVMIKFCANPEGVVTYAKFTQRGSTTLNAQLKKLAIAAVREMRLAPVGTNEDCGVVGFNF